MQAPRKSIAVPEVAPQPGPLGPAPLPPPAKPKRRKLVAVLIAVLGVGAAVVYWGLRVAPKTETAAGPAAALRTAIVQTGALERTLRISGKTAASNYVNITSPRMEGSRSRRGASASGGSIGVTGNVNVASTSSIAPSSTMSSLSQTGTVASSSSASRSGGGIAGVSGVGSSRLQASTSRLGSSSGRSGGNVSTSSGQSGQTAMGSSGLGSTASNLSGGSSGPPAIGGSGGGRRRGDFHLVLQKVVPAGSRVKKGDIIAEFDRQYMLNRLDDYEASVAMQEANLRKIRADIDVNQEAHDQSIKGAKAALDKAKLDIRATPVLSAIQAERLKLALEQAEAEYKQLLFEVPYVLASHESEIRTSELDVQQAELELRRANANVEKLVVRAPIDGMVVMLSTFRSGEMGQVREGDELYSGQPFMQVVDTSSMVVEATVNQVDVEQVRIGMKARVRFDAFPGLELPARVYSIGTVAKASRFRREYVTEVPVQLKLEALDPRVIPDLSVSADIVLEPAEQGVIAPLGGIFREAGGETYVYARRGQSWEKQPVELGLQTHVAAIVRSGLAPGDEIALEPPRGKTAGM